MAGPIRRGLLSPAVALPNRRRSITLAGDGFSQYVEQPACRSPPCDTAAPGAPRPGRAAAAGGDDGATSARIRPSRVGRCQRPPAEDQEARPSTSRGVLRRACKMSGIGDVDARWGSSPVPRHARPPESVGDRPCCPRRWPDCPASGAAGQRPAVGDLARRSRSNWRIAAPDLCGRGRARSGPAARDHGAGRPAVTPGAASSASTRAFGRPSVRRTARVVIASMTFSCRSHPFAGAGPLRRDPRLAGWAGPSGSGGRIVSLDDHGGSPPPSLEARPGCRKLACPGACRLFGADDPTRSSIDAHPRRNRTTTILQA